MRDGAMDMWCSQLQHPADVRPSDEVPGGTHHVCAKDPACVECTIDHGFSRRHRQSKAERPFCRGDLLCLHRTQPRHDISGLAMGALRDALIVKSLLWDLVHAHVEASDR